MDYYTQMLVREGTLVEYAPNRFVDADLAQNPAQRAALVCPLLPSGATPTGLTASWIHTGWWPQTKLIRLYCARFHNPHPHVTSRWDLHDDSAIELAGHRIPNPARTAFDLLVSEKLDVALEGCLVLLSSCLSITELREQGWMEKNRRKAPFARRIIKELENYLSFTRLEPVTR